MKALDIMEAAGGIDDEILMEVTSAMQEKNTGKPLRAKRTLRTVLIAAALVLVLAERPCRRTAHQQFRAGGQGRAAGNCKNAGHGHSLFGIPLF